MSRTRLRSRLLAALVAGAGAVALVVTLNPAAEAISNSTCRGGTLPSGVYRSVVVRHACNVPAGADIVVKGSVRVIGRDASFIALAPADINIMGNARVRRHGVFGLGVPNEGTGCPTDVHAVVHGNVVARHARTMYLDCTTIYGNVVSRGGGAGGFGPACEASQDVRPLNFVVKDNKIHGRTLVRGWEGCWIGYIRNVSYGTVRLIHNQTGDADSSEFVTNRIFGNLVCLRNSPAPQIGDSMGEKNVVFGHKVGQCAML